MAGPVLMGGWRCRVDVVCADRRVEWSRLVERPPAFRASGCTVVGTVCRRVEALPGMIGTGTTAGVVVVVGKAAELDAALGLVLREAFTTPARER